MGNLAMPDNVAPEYDVAIVSCDIVGHSSSRLEKQIERIAAINAFVSEWLDVAAEGNVVWASGGDGGHVVFRRDDWCQLASDLIVRLRIWSLRENAPLRIIAHYGKVANISGADGRIQFIGEGINTAGWMLTRGMRGGVVVSREFQLAFEHSGGASGVEFHDPRTLRDKLNHDRLIMLMSSSSYKSQWTGVVEDDRQQLANAAARKDGWSILYFAKRLLQMNTSDLAALRALQTLEPGDLSYKGPDGYKINPFFGHLGSTQLYEVLQLGQLVERKYNEVLCRYGEQGDTMFIILRGQVGVYKSEGEGSSQATTPMFTHREGEIIGELAFALACNRTADVIALSDVALLSFNLEEVSSRLPAQRSGNMAREQISHYIDSRILEHVSHHVRYLLGPDRKGPFSVGSTSWEDAISKLLDHIQVILLDAGQRKVEFKDRGGFAFGDGSTGIFILLSGVLRYDPGDVELAGDSSFPLIWSNVPGVLVLPERSYSVVNNPIKILFVDVEGLNKLEPPKREALYRGLRRAASHCYLYDAFISYNTEDVEIARRWAEGLRERGLLVFMDESRGGLEFPRRLRMAILNSRAIVSIVSENVSVRSEDFNWVLRETMFHRACFDETSRIFPVRYPGGDHRSIAPGFAPFDVDGDERRVVRVIAEFLERMRSGNEEPPFLLESKEMGDLL